MKKDKDLAIAMTMFLIFLAVISVFCLGLSISTAKAFQMFQFSIGGLVVLAAAEILSDRRY